MKAKGSVVVLVLAFLPILVAREALTQPRGQPVRPIPVPGGRPVLTSGGPTSTPLPEHFSTEVEFPACWMTVHIGIGFEPAFLDLMDPTTEDAGRLFPEWWEVGRPHVSDHRTGSTPIDTTPASYPAILEGIVESETSTPTSANPSNTGGPQGDRDHRGIDFTPHVTHDDMPISHFTHDLNVHLRPDPTPDNRFTNIAGIQVAHPIFDPCVRYREDLEKQQVRVMMSGADGAAAVAQARKDLEMLAKPACKVTRQPDRKSRQPLVEIEWESGVAADNDGNPCAAANRRGDSCGFASAGHTRGSELWNWPTEGDHVHVEGEWIWDRGHPPADTEMHPPRFASVQRKLPDVIDVAASGSRAGSNAFVATRVDIFANGDGTAFINNTKGPYAGNYGVRRVAMSAKDYEVTIDQPLPRPTPTAAMRFVWEKHNGDTFPADPVVTVFADATDPRDHRVPQTTPHVVVQIPWKSAHASDSAVFARTLHVYWDDPPSLGVAASGRPRAFRVTLDSLDIKNALQLVRFMPDPANPGGGLVATKMPAPWRVFAEVGGHWIFLNEIFPGDVLRQNLGATGARSWSIKKSFTVYVPPQGRFRVYSGGWEAGGANQLFGQLIDPNSPCTDGLRNRLLDELKKLISGNGYDTPIGEMAFAVIPGPARMNGYSATRPGAASIDDDPIRGKIDPNGIYALTFHVDEIDLPRPGAAGPLRE